MYSQDPDELTWSIQDLGTLYPIARAPEPGGRFVTGDKIPGARKVHKALQAAGPFADDEVRELSRRYTATQSLHFWLQHSGATKVST
jgi:hypothetical protein